MKTNSGKTSSFKTALRFAALAAILFSLISCQAFFTTSLASGLARTSYPLPANMSAAQQSQYLQLALEQNNQELADALLPQLLSSAAAATPGPAQDALLGDLFDATLLSSGIGTTISTVLPDALAALTGGAPDLDAIFITLQSSLPAALSAPEIAALTLFAADPPADADPNTMIMAAAAVVLISSNLSLTALEGMTEVDLRLLPGMDLALDLAEQAQLISVANGIPFIFPFPFAF